MWNGETVFKVTFKPSKSYESTKRASHPIAVYQCSPTNSFTFSFSDKAKDGKLYYACNQCVAAKRKKPVEGARGRTIHIYDEEVVNGDPSEGHYPGCVPESSAKVHSESKKRKGAQLVRTGLSSVSLARINLHAEMTRECEAAGVDENEARLSWSKKSITNRLSYAKMSCIPPMTESGELPEQLKSTNTGQQFLRFEGPDGSKLFVDDAGLDFLSRSNCWKGDGTFKSAPNGFVQAYSLHARHLRGESVPVVHMLLKGKDNDDYYPMFKFLNDLLEERSGNSSIGALSLVLFDFETAARKAFVAAFQTVQRGIKVRGCRFHFGQAIIRNVDAKGLKTIKSQAEVAKWLKQAHDEHVTRMVQLDAGQPLKRRDPRYVKLDENIARAKMRFQAREAIEIMAEAPDMSDIILRHLRYVSCLFGYAKWNDADSIDANLNEAVPNAANIDADLEVESVATEGTVLDPAQISIFDSAPALHTVQQQPKCPAFIHTFLPPCTHRRPVLPVVQSPVAHLPVVPPSSLTTHTFLPPLYDAHAMAVLDVPLHDRDDCPADETETAAGQQQPKCPAFVHTFLPPCTHRRPVLPVAQLPVAPSPIAQLPVAPSSRPMHTFLPPLHDAHAMAVLDAPFEDIDESPDGETETAAAAISTATTSALNAVYSMCMRCSEFTLDVCARCSRPLHGTCAPITGDPVFFCEECGTTIVQRGIANADLRRRGEYDAIEAELSQYFLH